VHGGDYSALEQCRACHNNALLRADGNFDLKFLIHAYHAGNLDDDDDPATATKVAVHYPDSIANCEQCHLSSQLELPLAANPWAPLTENDPADAYTSSTAFVCASCHLQTQPRFVDPADLSGLPAADQALVGHMIQMGAVFNGTQAAANVTESCAVCHGSGSLAAIDAVHGAGN
jgi:OmcA/MtrC family decaheme c-type cytochrome